VVGLDRLVDHRPDRLGIIEAGFLHRLLVQLLRGEQRAPLLDAAVVADVARLQRPPARVGLRRDNLLQGLAIRVLARAEHRRQQQQALEESGVHLEGHVRRADHFLCIGDHVLDLLRLPLHAGRERIERAQDPQVVVALAHQPQARARLLAGHHHRGFGADAVARQRLRLGDRRSRNLRLRVHLLRAQRQRQRHHHTHHRHREHRQAHPARPC